MLTSGLGVKLRQLRESAGLTQQALATKASVSWSTVSKLEQGSVRKPSAITLQKLMKALDYDLDILLEDKPIPVHVLHRRQRTATKIPIKFVFFDIGGVLAHTESLLLQHLAAELDRPLDKVKSLYHNYAPVAMRGRLSIQDIQLLFLFKLNVDYKRYRQIIFSDWVDNMKPNKAVHEFAREVSRTYPIGLLTNIMEGVLPQMRKRKLVPDLPYKCVIESCKVGLIKPEIEIYELATEMSGVAATDILFIDDRKVNVKGARAMGWHAEWFNETKTEASIARIKRRYF